MPQVLDIPNQVPREASKIYYHYIYWFHDTLFGSNILPIQKPNLQELLDFQKKDNTVNKNSILIKKVLNSPRNLRCCFVFRHLSYYHNHSYNPQQQSISPSQIIFPFLLFFPTCSPNHPHNLYQNALPLYVSCVSPPCFYIQPPLQF